MIFACTDKLKASRTVTYEIRKGSFTPRVCACETNSAAWRKFELPTTFAYRYPQKSDGSSSGGDYSLCGARLCLTLP